MKYLKFPFLAKRGLHQKFAQDILIKHGDTGLKTKGK